MSMERSSCLTTVSGWSTSARTYISTRSLPFATFRIWLNNKKKLVSASLDCTVKIWDLENINFNGGDQMDLVEDQKHASKFLMKHDSSEFILSSVDTFGVIKTFDIRMLV